MRDGTVTNDDWRLLLEHSTKNVDMSQFSDAIRLFFDRKSAAEYNYEKLRANREPICKIHAKHSGVGASAATSDIAGGLDAILFLSKKAEVMLTSNLWTEAGFCNGSFDVVEQFWFTENLGPPNLKLSVIVHFPGYTGPQCLSTCETWGPVPPKVFYWMEDVTFLSRQQISLRLRYAMTILKSQCQTLSQALVVLFTCQKGFGCTFPSTSRVKTIDGTVF